MENAKPIESAKLCLDGAIKLLQKGKDTKSYLFQFCMQMSRHCEEEGNKKQAQFFKERAEIIKAIPN